VSNPEADEEQGTEIQESSVVEDTTYSVLKIYKFENEVGINKKY